MYHGAVSLISALARRRFACGRKRLLNIRPSGNSFLLCCYRYHGITQRANFSATFSIRLKSKFLFKKLYTLYSAGMLWATPGAKGGGHRQGPPPLNTPQFAACFSLICFQPMS